MKINATLFITFDKSPQYLLLLHVWFSGKKIKAPKTLLNWKVVHEKMPWNIILLLGGGYALAKGSEVNVCWEASWCRFTGL